MHHPIDRITHTTAFVTQVVEHWLEREIAQWVMCKRSVYGFRAHSRTVCKQHCEFRAHPRDCSNEIYGSDMNWWGWGGGDYLHAHIH